MDTTNDIKSSPMHVEEAEVHAPSEELSLWQAVRRWPKVAGYCLALTTAILLWGYDMAMAGNLAGLDQFKEDFGKLDDDEWIIESKWISLWNFASPFGMIFGALAGGALQDRIGRRLSLALGSITSAAGVGVLYASSTAASPEAVFMVGKMLSGLSIGIVVCITQTYMSEVLPSVLRGPLIAFFPVFFLIGQLVSAVITLVLEDTPGDRSYLLCIISMWPFSAVPAVVGLLMPESPTHFIRKGNPDAALKAQLRLDSPGMDSAKNIRQIQASIAHEREIAQSDRSGYIDCFKGIDRRRTYIAMFSACVPQFFGLPILGDGPYFLQIAGMDSDDSLIFLVAGVVGGIIGTLLSMWLLTFVGRRRLILSTLTPLTVLWLGMGIAGCFSSVVVAWYVGVTSNLVCFIAAMGVWPASYVVMGEVSSLRLRAKTQGVAWALQSLANFLFSFVTPYIYNADAGNLRSKIGFVWVAVCGFALVGSWFLIPETLGRTPLQLDYMFERKVATRKFRQWLDEDLALAIAASASEAEQRK